MSVQDLEWPAVPPEWPLLPEAPGTGEDGYEGEDSWELGDDDWDIDVRFDELSGWFAPGTLLDFVPTGADGGTSCNTQATCANTCPATCAQTCQATCADSCGGTCGRTCENTVCGTCANTHCNTCRC